MKGHQLFWGEIHSRTDLSDGNGSPQENFEIARSHLDFGAMADHAYDAVFRRNHIEREILDLIKNHHDRERMNTPDGAPIFDADLIVNLKEEESPDRQAILAREALTEAGKRIGAARL